MLTAGAHDVRLTRVGRECPSAYLYVIESSEFCWIHQVVQRHADCERECFSVVDGDVDRASLDPAQVGPRHPGIERQALLR